MLAIEEEAVLLFGTYDWQANLNEGLKNVFWRMFLL